MTVEERYAKIATMLEAGSTTRDIATAFGVGYNRAYYLVAESQRRQRCAQRRKKAAA